MLSTAGTDTAIHQRRISARPRRNIAKKYGAAPKNAKYAIGSHIGIGRPYVVNADHWPPASANQTRAKISITGSLTLANVPPRAAINMSGLPVRRHNTSPTTRTAAQTTASTIVITACGVAGTGMSTGG